MPSNQTTNYKLNQWAAEDQVRRVDFNSDNSKIDAALAKKAERTDLTALETTVSAKADKSALTALETAVSKKAEKTDLDSLKKTVDTLSGTVTGHTGTMKTLGNCQIEHTTYVGSGEAVHTIPLPANTLLVIINGSNLTTLTAVRGASPIISINGGGYGMSLTAVWAERSLTLTYNGSSGGPADATCNSAKATYNMITLRTL